MRSPIRVIRLVRNVDAGRLLDSFLLTSVLTVLVARLYLYVTGYPQIGNSSLHISHLLPGGLLMLAALMLLLACINRSARDIAAVVGGIGFGLFWDEIGKFITKDNNYFFQPAAALIYITFVVIYLLTRLIVQHQLQPDDYLANAIDLVMEGSMNDLDPREYRQAQQLLTRANPDHPLYRPTLELLEQAKPTKDYRPFLLERVANIVHQPFHILVNKRWFRPLLIALFYAYGIGFLGTTGWLIVTGNAKPIKDILAGSSLSTNSVAATSSIFCAIFVVWGVLLVHVGRMQQGLRRFETALLGNIFVTQTFLFLRYQFWAVLSLAIALFVLFSIRLLQSETRE